MFTKIRLLECGGVEIDQLSSCQPGFICGATDRLSISHHSTIGVEMSTENYVLSRNKSWRILIIMKKLSVNFL